MRDIGAQVDQDELRSFARSLGEVHWLSLILVVLYALAPGAEIANPQVIRWAIAAYAGFIIIFRLGLARGRDTRLRIATEVIAMIAFVYGFGILVVWRHRSNLRRIWTGQEHRAGRSREEKR